MHIETLQTFIRVVDEGNISRVAEEMNLSQSALSQQIKTLEQHLDVVLLDRGPNGVSPTVYGTILYRYATQLWTVWENLEISLAECIKANKVFRILATSNMYSYALPCTLFHLRQKFPDFVLDTELSGSQEIEKLVSEERADVGFIVGKPLDPQLQNKKVFSDQIHLIKSVNSNLPDSVSCKELSRYPMLMLGKKHRTRQILDQQLNDYGIDVAEMQILYELNSTESLKMSTLQGYGYAFAPYMSMRRELYNKQVKIVQIDCFAAEAEYYMINKESVHQKNSEHRQLVNYLVKGIQDIIC